MNARQSHVHTLLFGDDLSQVFPIVNDDGSDSAMFDNALEFLLLTGRALPHAAMMMIPQPWEKDRTMSRELRAFYEFHSHVMDAWDGPAAMAMDRRRAGPGHAGQKRPASSRYLITTDGLLVMASETGALELPAERVLRRDRLRPGRMLMVDTQAGRPL